MGRCYSVLSTLDNVGSLQIVDAAQYHHRAGASSSVSLVVQGLTVVFYAAFEDFLTQISLERLKTINPLNVSIDLLPAALRKEMAEGAMRTLVARLRFLAKDAVEAEVAREAGNFASVSAPNNYGFSSYMFMPNGTNVSPDDIASYLKMLCIRAPWRNLSTVASRAGNGSPSLMEAVKADAKLRNGAAHEGDQSITISDLEDMVKRLRAVSFAYEVLLNRSLMHIEEGNCNGVSCGLTESDLDIEILFVEKGSGNFRVLRDGQTRALKRCENLQQAADYGLQLLRGRSGVVVLRDADGMVTDWWL